MLRKLFVLALLLPGMAGAGGLEHVGTPVPNQPSVGPYSVDIPAEQGLKSILPPNWQLYLQDTLVLPEALVWDHSDTWVTVLESLAAASDTQITVDWTASSVFVAGPAPVATPATARAPAPGWQAAPNTSLQTALREWSEKSGWHLQWDLDADLMMLTGFEHAGDFEGAVKALLAAVRSSGGPDIRAGLYIGNKTLRVHAPAF